MIRRLALALCALVLWVPPAAAQYVPGYAPGFRGGFQFAGSGFPAPGAIVDYDFKNARFSGPAITVTRSTAAYIDDAAGNWTLVPANTLRRSNKGALIEGAQTNDALYASDLTQTVWTKTGATAALTQTGFDGTTNGATLLTATAANGSVTQAITSASSLRTTSVFLRRVTGSGAVQITQDNTNWTTCTVTVVYSRCQVSSTIANPTVGVRLATSGDAVAVDIVQDEIWSASVTTTGGASSPIRTTGATSTRAADIIIAAVNNPASVSIIAIGYRTIPAIASGGIYGLASFDDGSTTNNRIQLRLSSGSEAGQLIVSSAGSTTINISATTPPVGLSRSAYAAAAGPGDAALFVNGSQIGTSTGSPPAAASNNVLRIGGIVGGAASYWHGYIERIAIYPYRAQNLTTLSSLSNWGG